MPNTRGFLSCRLLLLLLSLAVLRRRGSIPAVFGSVSDFPALVAAAAAIALDCD